MRGGAAKLPVPRSSCFRREPEDAVCGRNSGPTDGRPAPRVWKVSSRVGLATPARLGGLGERGSTTGFLGSGADSAPGEDREAGPQETPSGSGGPGGGRSAALRLRPFPGANLRALFWILYLVLGVRACERDCPEKAGRSESPGRGPRTTPAVRPLRGPWGLTLRPLWWGKGS